MGGRVPQAFQRHRQYSAVAGLAILLLIKCTGGFPDKMACTPLTAIPRECQHLLLNDDDAQCRHNWMLRINLTGGSLYNISIQEGTMFQTGLIDYPHYGNALSPYWFGRAIARFAGLAYEMLPGFDPHGVKDWFHSSSFLRYLPTKVAKPQCPDLVALKEACNECHCRCLTYPLSATSVWPRILNIIKVDMQVAFEKWANASNATIPKFDKGDVVIQDRCDDSTLLQHSAYGPPGFSFYQGIAKQNPKNIYIIRDPNLKGDMPAHRNRPFYPCRAMHEVLCCYLAAEVPTATIHSIGHQNIDDDWARVLLAPILYKGTSTFTVWAGLASSGVVFSPPLFPAEYYAEQAPSNVTPDFGQNWHWVNVSILNATEAKKIGPPKLTYNQIDRVISWLMHN